MNNLRSLAAGNKKRFAIFAIIIIIIIILLITCLRLALNHETEGYKIESNVTLYDSEFEPLELEETGTMTKKWDGNYYVTSDNSKETFKLNPEVVSYNENNSQVTLYGDIYKVLFDGQVEKYSKDTEIKNTSEDQFYKIAERQYLMISNSIKNDSGSINTSKYLYIIIDKSGNTLLLNNQIYAKTINPIVLATSSYKFDIANEKLIVGNNEIDLKKIIGSSNEYVEKDDKEEQNNLTEQTQPNEQSQQENSGSSNNGANGSSSNGGTNYGGTNYGGSVQNNNGSAINGQQNQSNINSGSGINTGNNNNGQSIANGNSNTNKTPLSKSVSLRGAIATSSYIDIEYAVQDPENKYQTVYALVEAVGYENTIALDKNATTYRLTDLEPNTEYKITLGYKEITSDNGVVDNIEDVLSVRTAKIKASIDVTRVAPGSKKVYFNVKLDQNYPFDSAKIVLYIDGVHQSEMNVDLSQAIKTDGWSNVLSYEESNGSEITLQLEGISHDGSVVNSNIQAKYRNY